MDDKLLRKFQGRRRTCNACLTRLRQKGATAQTQLFDERVHAVASRHPDREALVMREMEEMPHKEIAEMAGVPIGTIMSRLSRARKRLKDCLTSVAGARK